MFLGDGCPLDAVQFFVNGGAASARIIDADEVDIHIGTPASE
jgi:hypothetical protein